MRITTILGSPKRNGNTAAILKAFEKLAQANNSIDRINITEMTIKGCRGCDACQLKADVPGCLQKDDFQEVINRIMNADFIVYASPVYVWDFPAQMKTLIDRHYCLVKWKNYDKEIYLLENKHTALLATCGGEAENNADLIQEIYKREMNYLHCNIVGNYIVSLCTVPSELGSKTEQTAQQMAKDFIKT